MSGRNTCFACVLAVSLVLPSVSRAGLEFGFARHDATPKAGLRLSGYGNRDKPSEGVDTPLHVRAMAFRQGADGPLHVLVSIDSIGFPASFVQEIVTAIEQQHALSRARIAVCATHSHTTPHLARGLDNLFSTPLTDGERVAAVAYTNHLRDACVAAVGEAVAGLAPGRMQLLTGKATFARNRRVLKDGVWSGFGENADGPVDHGLPVLVVTDATGDRVRGIVFNYACHCTTFGGDYNRVNADWAGYAAEYLEAAYPESVAVCTIGCGADQNPERDSKRALDIARVQGREIADEVGRLWREGPRVEVTAAPLASFGYAGLPIDRPTVDDLKKSLEDKRPQTKRHAQFMLDTHARMGRLPESYPMPIQVWRFGDEFALVFLGGEVCVDYAYRVREELRPKLAPPAGPASADGAPPPRRIWVTAYANDVFGYVASERMRAEGGYEVDFSMIYYLQPGRWSSGTEDVILRRVHELFDQQAGQEPLPVSKAIETFTLPEGLEIDVVASEPLIQDPVNMAVDARGRLWVVEMGDYPRGAPDASGWSPGLTPGGKPWDGPPGGRIKTLTDTDGDGRYDEAVTFLDGLTFPTGVYPWRDGVVISGAPEIFFARDRDGDGRADHREVLYTGFEEANPQHRVNGFEYGLDGWLYLASGVSNGAIKCVRTGEVINVAGRDLRIHPYTGALEPVSGRSQYGRCRDSFGNWFGDTNSEPLFQFVIEDSQLRRNPFVATPSPRALLTDPPRAPPVYPTSRTLDRFNDLYAANRFTSACSPNTFRDESLGADAARSVFICEPVHNLVSRVLIERDGPAFTASRHPAEQHSEFLSSTDPWFRPVRLMTGPDGSLWVCDMYRQVIEHPQWIPEAWQARLNLSAGSDRGRIYRVRKIGSGKERSQPVPNLDAMSEIELASQLKHPNGWRRDTAQRLLLERADHQDAKLLAAVRRIALGDSAAAVRTQALWTLVGLDPSAVRDVALRQSFFEAEDPELVIQGLRALDPADALLRLSAHPVSRVRYEVALAAGEASNSHVRQKVLSDLAIRDPDDPWMRAAVLSSARHDAVRILQDVLRSSPATSDRDALVEGLIATALADHPEKGVAEVLAAIAPKAGAAAEDWQLSSLAGCLDGLARRRLTIASLEAKNDPAISDALQRIAPLFGAAHKVVAHAAASPESRAAAVRLLGRRPQDVDADASQLSELLAPQEPPAVQAAVIDRLADLGRADSLLESLSRVAPQQQATIEAALLARRGLTQQLLAAIEKGEVPPARLSAATRSALTNHRDEAIRESAAKCLNIAAAGPDPSVGARLDAVQSRKGDAAHGRVAFEKRCAACHRHNGVGADVGPQLGALQNKSVDFLLTSILDANRSVEPRYRACNVLLVDGRQQTGLIADETATSLVLVTADGRKHSVLRRDIEELVLTNLSFMPDGLGRDLSDQELADVIAFVQSGSGGPGSD